MAQVTVHWIPSDSPEIIGYKIYCGSEPGVYNEANSPLTVGTVSSAVYVLPDTPATWYFVVTGFDSTGKETSFTPEIQYVHPGGFTAFWVDDFEAGFGNWAVNDPSVIQRVSTLAHSGSWSIREYFQTLDNTHEELAGGGADRTFPSSTEVYLHWWMYLSPDWQTGSPQTKVLYCVDQDLSNYPNYVIIMHDIGGPQLLIAGQSIYYAGDSVNFYQNVGSPVNLSLGAWHEAEFHVRHNDPGMANGVVQLWIDGVLKCNYSGLELRGPTANGELSQISIYRQYGLGYLYLDDIGVGTTRIGGGIPTIIGQSVVVTKRPVLHGSGYVKIIGPSAVVAQRPRITGAGTVSAAAITGYSAILASCPVLSGSGVVTTPITGVSAIAASRPVIASAGTIAITGQSAVVARRPVIVSVGGGLGGPSAVIAPRPRLTGVGEIYPGGIGGSSVIVAHRPYLTGAGEVIIPITGTSAVVASRPVVSSAGTVAVTGTSAVTAGRPTLDGLGITGIGGPSEVIASCPRITGTGSVGIKGQGVVLVPRPRLTGSGLVVSSAPEGTSSIIAQRPRITGTGTIGKRTGKPDTAPGKKKAAITGTSAVHAQRPRLTGAGLVSIPAIDGESAVVALRPILTGEGTVAESSIDGTSAIVAARPVLTGDGLITLPTLYGDSAVLASRPVVAGSGEINAAPIDGTSRIVVSRPILTGSGFINIPLPVVAGAKFGAMYYELESFLMPYWIAAEARKAGPVTPPADVKRGSPLAVDPCKQECGIGVG